MLHNREYRMRASNRIVQSIYTELTPQQKQERDRKLHTNFLASLKLPKLNNSSAADKTDTFFKTQLEDTAGGVSINETEPKLLPSIERSPMQSFSKEDLRMLALKKTKKGTVKQRTEANSPQRKHLPSEERGKNDNAKAMNENIKLPSKRIHYETLYSSLLEIGKQSMQNEFDFLKEKGAKNKPARKNSTNNAMRVSEKENGSENLPLKVFLT